MTTQPSGDSSEEAWTTEDDGLAARLGEITRTAYHDPEVEVVLEDFSDEGEDGATTSGMAVRLRPRVLETEEQIREIVEDATGMSYGDWLASRAARPSIERPSPEERLERGIAEAVRLGEEESVFRVFLTPEPTTEIPGQYTSPIARNALEVLDWRLRRSEAIVQRGDEIAGLQRPFLDWLEERGGTAVSRHWHRNVVYVRVAPELGREIMQREDVVGIERPTPIEPLGIWPRDTVRDKLQVEHYLDAGYVGDRDSSRNAHGIWVAILEAADQVDATHSGMKNDSNFLSTRVEATWDCDCPFFWPCWCDGGLDDCDGPHGMHVASAAVADFMDGQHSKVIGTERSRRSGIAQEASIDLVTMSDGWLGGAVEQLMEDNVDIVNYSAGEGDNSCDPDDYYAQAVNDAYHDGILWISGMGNENNCGAAHCSAKSEAAASGSVAVAQHATSDTSDLDSKLLCTISSDGRASWGHVADLTAPGGLYIPMLCGDVFDNDTPSCGGTSYATPHVTGSAALLQHYWISRYSDTTAHQPGRMHAVLLNMADGCGNESNFDGRFGAGRLRMRMYDNPGLDSPWRHRTESTTLTSADQSTTWGLNDLSGTNLAIPDTVDALSATAFCFFEDPSLSNTPDIFFQLCDLDVNQCYTMGDFVGEKSRLRANPLNHRYEIRLTVAPIPTGMTVPCWISYVWEDSARDDVDGPAGDSPGFEGIEPYPIAPNLAPSCLGAC